MSIWLIIGIISTFAVGFETAWIIAAWYWYKQHKKMISEFDIDMKKHIIKLAKEIEYMIKTKELNINV